jgi:RNA polymerase sigma factor (sigma-70 family)
MSQTSPQPAAPAAARRQPPRTSLGTLFSKKLPPKDGEFITAIWDKYLQHGGAEEERALIECYAPLVYMVAASGAKRRPQFHAEPFDDYISDGCLALIDLVRTQEKNCDSAFRFKCWRRVRKIIYNGIIDRRWMSHHANRSFSVARSQRSRLTQELGRLPTQREMAQTLRGLITNPDFFAGHEPLMRNAGDRSHLGAGHGMNRKPGQGGERPEDRMVDQDVLRLASEGLTSGERKTLKLLLAGVTPGEIAARMNISSSQIRQRLNGLLWKARANAELAAYLGTQSQPRPAPDAKGRYPSFFADRPADRAAIFGREGKADAADLDSAKALAFHALESGSSLRAAALAAGVHRRTLSRWIEEDAELREAIGDAPNRRAG